MIFIGDGGGGGATIDKIQQKCEYKPELSDFSQPDSNHPAFSNLNHFKKDDLYIFKKANLF